MVLSQFKLTTSQQFFVLFEMGLDLAEFVEQLVVLQYLEVLHVEVSLSVALELLPWLSWVDSFEDAESSEVLEGQLHYSDGITACQVLGCFTLGSLLDFLAHFIWRF